MAIPRGCASRKAKRRSRMRSWSKCAFSPSPGIASSRRWKRPIPTPALNASNVASQCNARTESGCMDDALSFLTCAYDAGQEGSVRREVGGVGRCGPGDCGSCPTWTRFSLLATRRAHALHADRDVRGAAQIHPAVPAHRTGQRQFGEPADQPADRHPALQSGERGAEAVMRA